MSFPYKQIKAESIQLPEVKLDLDAQYMYTVKQAIPCLTQMPFLDMTKLLDQLTEFTNFANELMLNLANSTIAIQERINNLDSRLQSIQSRVREVDSSINDKQLQTLDRERTCWKSEYPLPSNHFTKSSQPSYIIAAYEQCTPIPDLQILDEFRTDGQSSLKLFSYPEFFEEQWKLLMSKEHQGKQTAKERVAGTPLDPLSISPVKTGRERPRATESMVETPSTHVSLPPLPTPAPVVKAAPPPPPPPPVMLAPPPPPLNIPSSNVANVGTPSLAAPPKKEAGSDMNGFLSDIRGKQFALKKTEPISREAVKKANEPVGVAAILMRRAALEASDSDQDDEEEAEGWD